jgi:hypothetical protein
MNAQKTEAGCPSCQQDGKPASGVLLRIKSVIIQIIAVQFIDGNLEIERIPLEQLGIVARIL